MAPNSRRKKLKIFAIVVAAFAVFVLALHVWFSYNAERILEQIVYTRSNGKIRLNVKRFSFNYFTNYIEIKKSSLYSTDSLHQPTTYNVQIGRLSLKVESFIPLLFQRQLHIDSIKIYDPHITVFRWRPDTNGSKVDLSVPRELGQVYNSMLDGLDAFELKRMVISSGRFTLVNKMDADTEPVDISNIYLNLVRKTDEILPDDTPLPEDQIITLRTFNQNILFPNGRHRLAFKNLKLELLHNRIEIDSCTITANANDTSRSQYTIFFEKLMLVDVDFTAMYQRNLVKADSVYCIMPRFNITLYPQQADTTKKDKGAPPDPNKILQELTGDLHLAFVGVKDAGIHINIEGQKSRSIFNSNKDDFEIRGLRINADSSKPVVVDRFDMLVRDYRLYNEDSTTSFSFDSIQFSNNKIALSNFAVLTVPGNKGPRSVRDFKIPYFELEGLQWYSLIFDQTINAQQATLYNPNIYYKAKPKTTSRKSRGIFKVLQNLDSLMTLKKVSVVNGQVNMILGGNNRVKLQNASIILNSNELLNSKSSSGLRQSVEMLKFSSGTAQFKDFTAQLNDVDFAGKNQLMVKSIDVKNNSNTINANANNVRLNNMVVNEITNSILLDGIEWSDADILFKGLGTGGTKKASKGSATFNIQNLKGANTNIVFASNQLLINTFLNSISADNITKADGSPMAINNLKLSGRQMNVSKGPLVFSTQKYSVNDNAASAIHNLQFQNTTGTDTMQASIPLVNYKPDVNAILQNNLHFYNLQLQQPQLFFSSYKKQANDDKQKKGMQINIDNASMLSPLLELRLYKNDSLTHIHLPRSTNGNVQINNLQTTTSGLTLGGFSLNNNAVVFTSPKGQVLGVEDGTVAVKLSNVQLNNAKVNGSWSGIVDSLLLSKPKDFTFGKNNNKLSVELAAVQNLQLSSQYITNFSELIQNNLAILLRTKNGQYIDSNTTLKWYDSEYHARNKRFTLDSFIYKPTLPRDTLIARSPYQIDYKTIETGGIEITGLNLDKYAKDSAINANTITIASPLINVYRDKRPPFKAGIIKYLPVDIFEGIQYPVDIDKVQLKNGTLTYTEFSNITNLEGTITINKLNAEISNIKNRNITESDSLYLRLDGFLMDSARINLRVKESYKDSLSSFYMTLRMRPTSLTFLNPVLNSLANVKIVSGTIDSLHLRAIGHDQLAFGEMAMYYHNLKIQLIVDGDPNKTTFKTRVLSFLANTFIIRKNNNGRTGLVYFERLRDRSFFNYLVKMTMSGMSTNIGIKKNKKYLRKYRQQLDVKNLPPIEFDTDIN